MGCGSCVAKITKAIQQLDGEAAVRVDRAQGKVEVESAESLEAVCQVIADLGFPAVPAP
jgi:copper chaperone